MMLTVKAVHRPGRISAVPDDVEYRREDELVVNGDGHVAGLVEGGRHRPHGVAQVDGPQQEEELGCRGRKAESRTGVSGVMCV